MLLGRPRSPRALRRFRVAWACVLAAALLAPLQNATGAGVPMPADGIVVFWGHGWGHGRGMGQGGAQGQAQQGRTWTQIVSSYYKDTTIWTRGTETIRVLLEQSADVLVTSDATFTAVSGGKTVATSTQSLAFMRARPSGSSVVVERSASSTGPWAVATTTASPVTFVPSSAQLQLVYDSGGVRFYRGSIEARLPGGSSTLLAINDLPMQQYLYGVVPREMSPSWRTEALRAQAVAARTYAAYKKDGARAGGKLYDICATTSCQVYGGSGRKSSVGGSFQNLEASASNAAVDATNGKVIAYQGKPILAEYSSSTGGYTAPGSVPYLSPVPDPWDSVSSNHLWQARIPVKDIEKAWPSLGRLVSIRVTKRNGYGDWGGRVQELVMEGTASNVVTSGQNLRDNFAWPGRSEGLRSSWFIQTSVPFIEETANVVTNGSFEAGTSLWSAYGSFGTGDGYTSVQPRAGGRALYMRAGGRKAVVQGLSLVGRAGQRFDVSGWNATAGSSGGGGPIGLNLAFINTDGSVSWNLIQFPRATHDWTYGSATVTSAKPFKAAAIYVLFYDQTGIATFDAVRVARNTIANPSFEAGLTSWGADGLGPADGVTPDLSRDGSRALHLTGSSGTKSVGQVVPMWGPAGRVLVLRGWTRSEGTDPNGGDISYGINFYSAGGAQTSQVFTVPAAAHDWQIFETPVTPTVSYSSYRVFVAVAGQQGDVWFDGLRIEENVLDNPSFESDLAPWTPHGGFGGTDGIWYANPRDANRILGFTARSGRVGIQQHVVSAGAAGAQLVLGACNLAAGTNPGGGNIYLSIGFRNVDGSTTWRTVPFPRGPHDWVFREQIVTAAKTYAALDIYAIADNQTGNVRWDCAGLRALW